jgi:hypothetical protein
MNTSEFRCTHLRLYDTRQELREGIVAAWWELNRGGVMLVDTSNAECDALNRLAQQKRLEADEPGPEALTPANGREVRVGDRVLTSKHSVQLDTTLNPQGGPRPRGRVRPGAGRAAGL